MRAPVLPAETAAEAAPSLTCCIATRIEESFFLRKATSTESSIATTSVAATRAARAVGRADQQQAGIRMMVEKRAACRERDAGAMVAPHAVNGQCDHGRLVRPT